jgi:type IV secretion system protein VirB8
MADDGLRSRISGRANYYGGAESWASDVDGAMRTSRRIAWWIAGGATLVAVLEALALMFLAPLKTVVPYTILVDRQSGYIETVKGLQPGALSQNAAVTQSFLVQYVIGRETFDASDLSDNYRKVVLWSAGDARSGYQREMARTNPASPLNLYQASTLVSTTIKSVSLLSPDAALVRFDTTRHENGALTGDTRSWAAVIGFHYSGAPMTMGDRFINPLGFQVIRYRRDAESAPTSVAAGSLVGGPIR